MEPTKIKRISEFYRARIDKLHDEHVSPLLIHKRLLAELNVSISTQAIKLYIARRKREMEMGHRLPKARPRPEKRKLDAEHLAFIDMTMEANDETASTELQQKLSQRFGVDVSASTIRKARQQLDWTSTTSRYCQIVREVNREKRKLYCVDEVANDEKFNDVIFTDECTVKMQAHTRLSFRRRGSGRRLKGIPKHPYQVHVWAGISRLGATQISIFSGKMNIEGYQKILKKFLLPFIRDVYPDGHRLYRDNDPKHTSKSTKKFFEENGVKLMPAPPESPDLNPIEMMWASLKYHIRKNLKPTCKEELIDGIYEWWDQVDASRCNKYINHLYKVIPTVWEMEGRASGF